MACERLVRQGEAAIDSTRNCRAIKHSSDDPMAAPVKTNIFSSAEPVGPQPATGEGVKVFSVFPPTATEGFASHGAVVEPKASN